MNEIGDAAGGAALRGDQVVHATLWGRHGVTDLGAVGSDQCALAFSINSRDQVVGISGLDCGFAEANAFLWDDGHIIHLNAFVPSTFNLHLRAGITVNDRGEIVVAGVTPGGDRRAVLLVPCDDEPSWTDGCRSAAKRENDFSAPPTAPRATERMSPLDLLHGRAAVTHIPGRP